MALLRLPRDSGQWNLIERNSVYAQDPIEDEELIEAARETTATFFRVFELNKSPADSAAYLQARNQLPSEDEIRWLTDNLHGTFAANPKVVAALKKDKSAGLMDAALSFLRRANTGIAASEPAELDDYQAREWWIARWAERKRR